jgi:hypothetical protein
MRTEEHDTGRLIERIQRALVLLAFFIELDGDVHLPMYEKFEAELAELERLQSTRDRARRLLDSYQRSLNRGAGPEKNPSLTAPVSRFPDLEP